VIKVYLENGVVPFVVQRLLTTATCLGFRGIPFWDHLSGTRWSRPSREPREPERRH